MTNEQVQQLCLSLMQADTEAAVIALLSEAGFWDERDAWRYYGDCESNFSTIYNQASRSDAALVEKIVNCVDARLLNECQLAKIDPEGPLAPSSMRDAVARFFEQSPHSFQVRSSATRKLAADRQVGTTAGSGTRIPGAKSPCHQELGRRSDSGC